MSPTTEAILSIIDQDKKVSFIEILKYSLNIQKPVSLTWEQKMLPDPIAKTIRLASTWTDEMIGASIPAVVNPATVADPKKILIIAAINHPNNNGFIFKVSKDVAITPLTSLSIIICFNPPEAPIIKIMEEISFIPSS